MELNEWLFSYPDGKQSTNTKNDSYYVNTLEVSKIIPQAVNSLNWIGNDSELPIDRSQKYILEHKNKCGVKRAETESWGIFSLLSRLKRGKKKVTFNTMILCSLLMPELTKLYTPLYPYRCGLLYPALLGNPYRSYRQGWTGFSPLLYYAYCPSLFHLLGHLVASPAQKSLH